MELSITLPLDDGFLRRECSSCERQFKWFSGETEGRPQDVVDPEVYFCPYCGATAPPDEWWTTEQSEYAVEVARGPAVDMMARELGDALEPLNSAGLVSAGLEYPHSEPPASLHESSDMVIVEPPCHQWEPLKVEESWDQAFHCLLCGRLFSA